MTCAEGPGADVVALVQAAGRGERLGLGPKAFLPLDGRTLLERAVDMLRAVAGRVVVGVPAGDLDRARQLCGDRALVLAGGETRSETLVALVRATDSPLLLLHDVVHPFVTRELSRRVVEAARLHGAASAVVLSGSSGYHQGPDGTATRLPPGALWLTRKPIAFRRDVFEQGLVRLGREATGAGALIAAAGRRPALVSCEPWNIKVTTPDDWLLAVGLARWLAPGAEP